MDNDLKIPDPKEFMDKITPSGLILTCALIVGLSFFIWILLFRPKPKQKRKRNSERRKPNPTLAQTGGLPPPRDPNAPPRSPVP